jgi:guanylate kinase
MSAILFIVSAPSGSGKSTLVNEVRKSVPNLDFSISYTTRSPRGSEQNGREYYFVSRQEFERMIAEGEFLEHAEVFGNYYGTARRFLREAGSRDHDLLLDIDVQGAAQVKQKVPDAVSIFILPPSKSELERRLHRRSQAEGNVQEEVIQRRLQTATREIENFPKYSYILVNDRLEESIDQLEAILMSERAAHRGESPADLMKMRSQAEACRTANAYARLKPILDSFQLTASPSGL